MILTMIVMILGMILMKQTIPMTLIGMIIGILTIQMIAMTLGMILMKQTIPMKATGTGLISKKVKKHKMMVILILIPS